MSEKKELLHKYEFIKHIKLKLSLFQIMKLVHQCGFCKDQSRNLEELLYALSTMSFKLFYVNAQSEKVSVS